MSAARSLVVAVAVVAVVAVAAVAVALVDLSAVLSGVDPAVASDWPQHLGPTRDARSPETGAALAWPDGGPPLLWQRPLGSGYSMPSVAGGRAFVFDRVGGQARLTAIDAATGDEIWQTSYPTAYEDLYGFSDGPRASPVVDGDRVYTFGVEGRLRCHRVGSGSLVWAVDTAARFGVVQNFFGVGSTPLVEGELLIAPVGGSPPGSPAIHSGEVEGDGSGIVAFAKRTGRVRYALSDELASYASPVAADVGGRRLVFAFQRGGLVAFEPRSGELRFHFPWRARKLESVNAANPVVVGDTVFLSESYGPGSVVLRVREGGPEVVWQDPARKRDQSLRLHWMTPVHHDGILYGSSGSSQGDAELRAVELATGEVRWRQPGLGRATLLYVDGHLIVLSETGALTVIEATPDAYRVVAAATPMLPESGGAEAEPVVDGPAWNAPALARGRLYVRGKSRLACFDLRPSPSAPP